MENSSGRQVPILHGIYHHLHHRHRRCRSWTTDYSSQVQVSDYAYVYSSTVACALHDLSDVLLSIDAWNLTVFGLGCTLLYSTLSSRFRLSERFRLFWFYLWNTDETKDLTPFRCPAPASEATQLLQQTRDGESSVKLILSPNTTATSTLHVSVLTIAPGRELPSYPARAVEFYFVLSGAGSFSQQGVVETHAVAPGDCFVVDVGRMRWIANRKTNVSDLVLLRCTDGGLSYSRLHPADRIRRDPNHKASAAYSLETMLATGLRTVQTKARNYYSKNVSSSSDNTSSGISSLSKSKSFTTTNGGKNSKIRS